MKKGTGKRRTFTSQVIVRVLLVILLISFFSLLCLNTYRSQMNDLITDLTDNLDYAVVYDDITQIKENIELYLQQGTLLDTEEYDTKRKALQEDMGTSQERFLKGAGTEEDYIQRKNLSGMVIQFSEYADKTIRAMQEDEVDDYLACYSQMLDVYKQIDSYIKDVTSQQLLTKAALYKKVSDQLNRIFLMLTAVIILVCICGGLLVYFLSYSMTRPLHRLVSLVERMEEEQYDVEVEAEESNEEMHTLYQAVGQMEENIRNNLTVQQQKQELERRLQQQQMDNLTMQSRLQEAELRTLQAQINPHFLFNTINIGAQMASMEEDDATADYLYHVAELYRYTLKHEEHGVTLAAEVQHVENYIELMRVRFGEKYRFICRNQLSEEEQQRPVPKMILQPLVENAYNHGVRKNEDGGFVCLELLSGEDLCIRITDNGPGMSRERIQEILNGTLQKDTASGGNGVGLENVLSRLRLWCGREDVMTIQCQDGVTRFEIHLPLEGER